MDDETLLLNPGPVVLAPSIREAMSQPMISHRSAAFEAIYDEVRDGFEYIYTNSRADGEPAEWEGEVIVMNATATMGMEAAISNFVDPDDTVLACINGNFGRRFAQIADRNCSVEEYEIPWGESFDVDALGERILDGDYSIVTMVFTETSTGMRNPIGEVGRIVDRTDALFVVDGVSAIGGERLHPVEWSVDISVVDAQKAIAASPGVSAVYLSPDAVAALDADQGHFYADLHRHLERQTLSQTPFTSAVTLFYGLQAAFERIRDVGMDRWLDRHDRYARAWERTATAMGLDLFAKPAGPSDFANTVTAIELPEPVRADPEVFFEELRAHNVFVGGGHGHLSGEIFRLGTMGDLDLEKMERGIDAVGEAFGASGVDVDVAGAREALVETVGAAE